MDVPEGWDQILNDLASLEAENAELRRLLEKKKPAQDEEAS